MQLQKFIPQAVNPVSDAVHLIDGIQKIAGIEGFTQGVRLAKVAGKYAGRSPNLTAHRHIIALRDAGQTIKQTAELTGCSLSQVKRIWAMYLATARPAEG